MSMRCYLTENWGGDGGAPLLSPTDNPVVKYLMLNIAKGERKIKSPNPENCLLETYR